jgi:alkylhydroperoxidase family enzyme
LEELGALSDPANSPLFSERERAALAYAESITTASSVPDDVFKHVKQHFTEEEIIELTATITWEICAAKFNRALEIEGQGICMIQPAKPVT